MRRNLREKTLLLLRKLRRRRAGGPSLQGTTGIPRGRRWNIRRRTMSLLTLQIQRRMRFWMGCPSWENTSSWQLLPIETRETVAKRENPEEGCCEDFPKILQ